MLTLQKETKDGVLLVKLIGSVDESTKFDDLIGPVPSEIRVVCKEIQRINSVGVKSWIKYFQGLRNKGIKITYVDCSTSIIEQANLVSNFLAGGEIESLYVPYSCTTCHSELIALFKAQDIKTNYHRFLQIKCTKCAGKAIFDDIPEEYFSFLNR